MKLIDINGRPRFKNVASKRIDWDGDSRSKFQKSVKFYVRPLWNHHVVYEEFPVYGTRYTLDFFNATRKIAIEVQGGHHTKFNPFFHKNQFDYKEQLMRDEKKRRFCELNNINLIEIFYEDKKDLSISYLRELGL